MDFGSIEEYDKSNEFRVEEQSVKNQIHYPVIEMKQIKKSFGYVHALNGMDFKAYQGEVTAIVGDNGSGKSTLIKILTGCLKPDSGEIRIKDETFSNLSVRQAIEQGITTVYQDLALDNCKDCAGNIFLGKELMKWGIFLDHKKMRERTKELLERLQIYIPDIRQPVEKMSGGQRQALAIARAVHAGGDIMIFDEPTSAMGLKETSRIMNLFLELKKEGKTIILISHNLFQVFDIADRICVINNGRFVDSFLTKDSSPEELHRLIVEREEELGDEKMV